VECHAQTRVIKNISIDCNYMPSGSIRIASTDSGQRAARACPFFSHLSSGALVIRGYIGMLHTHNGILYVDGEDGYIYTPLSFMVGRAPNLNTSQIIFSCSPVARLRSPIHHIPRRKRHLSSCPTTTPQTESTILPIWPTNINLAGSDEDESVASEPFLIEKSIILWPF
jgi:hypothetical protein